MSDLRKLRDDAVTKLLRWAAGNYWSTSDEAREAAKVYIAALDAKPEPGFGEKKPYCEHVGNGCICDEYEANPCKGRPRPEPPKPAERTAEEILDRIQADNYDRRIEEALYLVRQLRAEREAWIRKHTIVVESYNKACDAAEAAEAERDALKARIEKAKARIAELRCSKFGIGSIRRILSGDA